MRRIFLIIIMSQFATVQMAFAALGERESQIASDQIKLRASKVQRTTRPRFSVHEITSDSNTVKEFVGDDGVVFAVSWRGTFRPDLKALFGSYYDEYHARDAARPRMMGRHPISITTDRLIVQKGGHMRDVHGLAYIPSKMPAGVQPEDLQ